MPVECINRVFCIVLVFRDVRGVVVLPTPSASLEGSRSTPAALSVLRTPPSAPAKMASTLIPQCRRGISPAKAPSSRRVPVTMSMAAPQRMWPWSRRVVLPPSDVNSTSSVASRTTEVTASLANSDASAVLPQNGSSPSEAQPVLCEGLFASRSGLPPEVERLAGGFTDAPEACPATGIASWWRYQGLKI